METNLVISSYVVGMVQTNFYYMHLKDSAETIVFDPADLGDRIWEALHAQGLEVRAIFLTHAHFDHIGGVEALKAKTGAPVYCSEDEKRLCKSPSMNSSSEYGKPVTIEPDIWLTEGEKVTVGGITVKMIKTPGHTEGSCCYYIESEGILVCGDTLFEMSVGRTDFPTGSFPTLVSSIRNKLFTLPDETVCLPGHGGTTTIGFEKQHNAFV